MIIIMIQAMLGDVSLNLSPAEFVLVVMTRLRLK